MHTDSCENYSITIYNIKKLLKIEGYERLGTYAFQVLLSTCGNPNGTRFSQIANLRKRKNWESVYHRINGKKQKGDLKNELIRIKYAKTMLAYARTLKVAGYNPVRFLEETFRQERLIKNKKGFLVGNKVLVLRDSKKSI
jgi:hypothetical protein